ncbi:3'-5' exonuclease [Nesterenkonia sp. CL21]|uniref:HelD family protein n=1 Tax=Nesterenkonia sp. CL21 TaxID=3064894 RepID=UPI00287B2A01|nr:3'-5' exonuclease [Nesterenkonia sp. CL21]MDS2173451.1 3'-5' exonuclease [Nesterenkonia sp. CL21]
MAGSGKTSIALHRVAFLLYRFKDTVSADDVLILSPNKVFGDYISNVLPELGEDEVPETDVEGLARRLLDGLVDFETFGEQVTSLLDGTDPQAAERIRYKSTPEFVAELEGWISDRAEWGFTPESIRQQGEELSADWAAERYAALESWPLFTRLERLAEGAVQRLKNAIPRRRTWTAADTRSVRKQVAAMFPDKDPWALYQSFYREGGRESMFRRMGRKKIEYADVFPLIHTILLTTRTASPYAEVRHLLVDEMQDYTPVQYAVLKQLFPCRMTILGDANQSVNPYSSSSAQAIRSIFPQADCLGLNRSYRSTLEITDFAQHISRNEKLTPVERHGPAPEVVPCSDREEEQAKILELISDFERSEHQSMGIICRTIDQARELDEVLRTHGVDATLLDYDSEELSGQIVLTSAHVAKGLEFDTVVVPGVDEENYRQDIDRGMLYIACTRAMHELTLTHHGRHCAFLDFAVEPAVA